MSASPKLPDTRARHDADEEDGSDEATRVGPMTLATIEALMRDADALALASPNPRPFGGRGARDSSVAGEADEPTARVAQSPDAPDELPAFCVPDFCGDEEVEPTVVNPRAGFFFAPNGIVEDGRAEPPPVHPNTGRAAHGLGAPMASPPPLVAAPPTATGSSRQGDARPAVFPEWLGVSFRPDEQRNNGSLLVALAFATAAFVATIALLWVLFA